MHATIHAVSFYSLKYNRLKATAFLMNALDSYVCMPPLPSRHVIISISSPKLATLKVSVVKWCWQVFSRFFPPPFVSSCFPCDIQHSHGCPREKWTKLHFERSKCISLFCTVKCITAVFIAVRAYDYFDATIGLIL